MPEQPRRDDSEDDGDQGGARGSNREAPLMGGEGIEPGFEDRGNPEALRRGATAGLSEFTGAGRADTASCTGGDREG